VVDGGKFELWQIIQAHAPFAHTLYHPRKTLLFIHNSNVLMIMYSFQPLQWLAWSNVYIKLVTTIKEAHKVMTTTLLDETFNWQTTYQSYNQQHQQDSPSERQVISHRKF
jgi:hypothetical protein